MVVTREQALSTLKALGAASIFVQSYRDEHLPKDLDLFFRPPEEFFLSPDTQERYTDGQLIPLLDDGSFNLVLFYDPESKLLLRKFVERPTDAIHYFNWQQYLADLMITIAESIDDDDETELVEIARLLEFKYLQETIAFLDTVSGQDHYETRKAEFIAALE